MKKYIIYGVGLFLAMLFALGFAYQRYDFTSDKRYTLTDASITVLNSVDKPLEIEVYLEGDFPANFQQFRENIESLLAEFETENSEISYRFLNPVEGEVNRDTLVAMGMKPSALPEKRNGKLTQLEIFPYAFITYNSKGIVVPLLTKKQENIEEVIKASTEELEYNFIEGIEALSHNKVRTVGWLNNHQSLSPIELTGFYQTLSKKYNVEPLFPFDSSGVILRKEYLPRLQGLDVMFIAKPREPYTDEEKLVLDQYVMNGGKILWMVDAVNAERDSLMRSGRITAFSNKLNINDLLFAYGIRLQGGLIKDYQRAGVIKVQTGEVQGNPQYAMPQWPFLPLGMDTDSRSPITKNLNPVLFQFASPIDTLANDIRKTVLYRSSPISDVVTTPSFVYLEDIVQPTSDSLLRSENHKGSQIMAVLLEGNFSSAYKGRFERSEIPNFIGNSAHNKMIFIADGDMPRNDVFQGRIPVPLGKDALTGVQYANADFLLNCVDYLTDNIGLMELRNRTIDQRLLDLQKVESEKSYWKRLNLLIPILFILISMLIGVFIRTKKFKQ